MSKERAFEQVARKYWEKSIKEILAPGDKGSFPSEGEFLCAYNEMKTRHPECTCKVLRNGKIQGDLFQQGDRIDGIEITAVLDAVGSVVEFTLDFSKACADVRMDLGSRGIGTFSDTRYNFDLTQTMKNTERVIDEFPAHIAAFQKEKMEYEKKMKIEQMAKASIKVGVSQALAPLGYEWDLVDKGDYFALRIGLGKKKLVEMTLNAKNFTRRLPVLQETLQNIENLLKKMTFPVEISMNKELVKL